MKPGPVMLVDVVRSQRVVDEDLKQATEHDCEGDGTRGCCSKHILRGLGNESNDTLTPSSGSPSDGSCEAKEEEEVTTEGEGFGGCACEAVEDASMEAITTAGLVLGIATESETKPILCNSPNASTMQVEGYRRKSRLTGHRLVTPPHLRPPLPRLVGDRDPLFSRLHRLSLATLSALKSPNSVSRGGVSIQHLERAVRLSPNLSSVVHPKHLLSHHPRRLTEKPICSIQRSPPVLDGLSRSCHALCT
jgi:hypothetical protein